MAAKAPAKSVKKTAKSVKSSGTSKGTSRLTGAQYQAYQKASKTAIQKAQLQHNARALQSRRLQGSVKARAKLAAKRQQTITARIGKNAVRQTFRQVVYARQSKPLRLQAAARLFKAQQIATQRQFAYLGEAIHARITTLQTLTDAQATTAEERYVRAARKNLTYKKTTGGTRKGKTSRSAYAVVGQAAGRAAARRVPASKTRTAARMQAVEVGEWITAGNDLDEENCVAVALANHLLYHTNWRVTDVQIDRLTNHYATNFARALHIIDNFYPWFGVGLSEYGMIAPEDARPGMLVGFDVVVNGEAVPHCGVLLEDNHVISWGEAVPLESQVDEVWEVMWTTTKRLS